MQWHKQKTKGDSMIIDIRLTENEKRLADSYAKMHSMSIGEAFKRALFEKIEDEYDLKTYEEAIAEYKANPITHNFMDICKE